MIGTTGTTFPPSIGTTLPASIDTTARREPARHQLARPWPWMIGTAARHDGHDRGKVDDRHGGMA